jgi:arylsulfatase A
MKLTFTFVFALLFACPTFGAERTNFIVVLADDLGYGDLHCFGSKEIQSPNLDKFASEGLRLTSCYAGHPNCSPSRTALMTGRTPTRVGVRNWIPEDSPMHLRNSEITIAKLLKQAGYATCHVGKWHLNGAFNKPTQPQPGDHGFDHWFSTQNNAVPSHRAPNNFVRNGQAVGTLDGYSSQAVVAEALRWLKSEREAAKPFFLYVCFHEPHEPIATAAEYAKLYPSADATYSAHHGNITQMDDSFGRLMRGLDELQLRDNTLVMFTSDNGPAITPRHPHGSAGPLRNKKGSVYEGGIRVPGIVRWPGKVQPGSVSDEPVCGVDLLPTVCAVAGIAAPTDRKLDGTSVLPVFQGGTARRETPLYWHFNQAMGGPLVALRNGDWKILATLDKSWAQGTAITEETESSFKTAELKDFQLYDLRHDIGEATDLAQTRPEKLNELKSQLAAKYAEVRAESPTWPKWTPPAPIKKQAK